MRPQISIPFCFLLLWSLNLNSPLSAAVVVQLPPDGAWARYYYTQYTDREGVETDHHAGTITVRSVGEVILNETDCRWIEFEFRSEGENGGDVKEVAKYLVPIDKVELNQDCVNHIQKAWVEQTPNETKQEANLPGFADHLMIPSELHNLKRIEEPKNLKYQQGEFALPTGMAGESHFENDRLRIRTEQRIWSDKASPFGTVVLEQSMKLHSARTNAAISTVVRKLELMEFGTQATSAIEAE